MKVEVWSDYACPYCYIGIRRFKAALDQFANKTEVEIIYRSFELDPDAKRDYDGNIHTLRANRYGMTIEQAKAANDKLEQEAAKIGLNFQLDTLIPTNTFNAHRLTHYAATKGKMGEITERLYKAFFTDSKHLGDEETLAVLGSEVGLNRDEVAAVLASDAFANEVREEEEDGNRLGIRGVPFYVINRKHGISGAQSIEAFLQALEIAWEDEKPQTHLEDLSDGGVSAICEDGTCNVPDLK